MPYLERKNSASQTFSFDTIFLGPSEDNAEVIVSQTIGQSNTSLNKQFKKKKQS